MLETTVLYSQKSCTKNRAVQQARKTYDVEEFDDFTHSYSPAWVPEGTTGHILLAQKQALMVFWGGVNSLPHETAIPAATVQGCIAFLCFSKLFRTAVSSTMYQYRVYTIWVEEEKESRRESERQTLTERSTGATRLQPNWAIHHALFNTNIYHTSMRIATSKCGELRCRRYHLLIPTCFHGRIRDLGRRGKLQQLGVSRASV